jgi:type I restriction enzyme, R subunit
MPFGQNNEHVPVRLIDFDDLSQNQYVVTQQYTYRAGPTERRADLVLLVNGMPLVLIEAKTPVKKPHQLGRWRGAGARRLRETCPSCSSATCSRWPPRARSTTTAPSACRSRTGGPGIWIEGDAQHHPLKSLKLSAESMLRPHVVLDILQLHPVRHGQEAAPHQDHLPLPAVRGANKIVERVVAGYPKKGLIWHFQGSGKSLLMVFAAQKLRMHPGWQPHGADRGGPDRPRHPDHRHLQRRRHAQHGRGRQPRGTAALLAQDVRKIIITTIFKFGEAGRR